jgi:hypothetical protein
MSTNTSLVPMECIERAILFIRGHKVMLSPELAGLYHVEPRILIQAVKRNLDRFPDDFMFQLTAEEWEDLKSQFVISSWGGVRVMPYAFTEQGVAMLSSVLTDQNQKSGSGSGSPLGLYRIAHVHQHQFDSDGANRAGHFADSRREGHVGFRSGSYLWSFHQGFESGRQTQCFAFSVRLHVST